MSDNDHESFSQADSKNLLDLIFNTADIGICVTNQHGEFVKVNEAYCKLYGYEERELLGQSFEMVLPEKIRDSSSELHYQYINGLTMKSAGEWQVRRKNGEIMHIWVTAGRFEDQTGDKFKVTTVTDITENKEYVMQLEKLVQQNDNLIKELHHRVKNNLNLISSLLYLEGTVIQKDRFQHSLTELRNRIAVLSLMHEKLYKSVDLENLSVKDYFADLVETIRISYLPQDAPVEILQQVEDGMISNSDAITLGLIVHEAVSNSLKYAFPSTKGGVVKISIKFESSNKSWIVIIEDDGVGVAVDNIDENASIGISIMKNLCRDGSFEIYSSPGEGTEIKAVIETSF
jgi:PAS domain S-box-containing protein